MASQKNETTILECEKTIKYVLNEIYKTELNFCLTLENFKKSSFLAELYHPDEAYPKRLKLSKEQKLELQRILKPFTEEFHSPLLPRLSPASNLKIEFSTDSITSDLVALIKHNNHEFTTFWQNLKKRILAYHQYIKFIDDKKNQDLVKQLSNLTPVMSDQLHVLQEYIMGPYQRALRYSLLLKNLQKEYIQLNKLKGRVDESGLSQLIKFITDLCDKLNELKDTDKQLATNNNASSNLKLEAETFNAKSFVRDFFHFDENAILKPFKEEPHLSLEELFEKSEKYQSFRDFLAENDLQVSNLNVKLLQKKSATEKDIHKRALWSGLIIISKQAKPKNKLDAWSEVSKLCNNNQFCFNLDSTFLFNIIQNTIKIAQVKPSQLGKRESGIDEFNIIRENQKPKEVEVSTKLKTDQHNKILADKILRIQNEINQMHGKWELGFFGRFFGARRYHFQNGDSIKMATGAFNILDHIHNDDDYETMIKEIKAIIEERVEISEKYKKHPSRKPSSKQLYLRIHNILNEDPDNQSSNDILVR